MVMMDTQFLQQESSSGDENASDSENKFDEMDKQSNKLNSGWADSVAKVLHINKPKGKRTLVLSKAKKLSDLKRKLNQKEINPSFEIESVTEQKEVEIKEEQSMCQSQTKKRKKQEIPSLRVKPNILDKDREKVLIKITTRGVVQLFNALRTQQKDITLKLEKAGPLERKQEQVLKNIDKRSFLDVLMGNSKSEEVDNIMKNEKNKVKSAENKNDFEVNNKKEDATWDVLKDDFMIGAKLKDWDKELTDDEDEINDNSNESD